MALPANIQQFKSSGVYRLEFDKSQLINIPSETIRLVIGYSNKGPFNTPIFVPDVPFFKDVFGEIYNVGSGTNHSVLDLVNIIEGEHIHLPPRDGEARDTKADIGKIMLDLDWYPQETIENWINNYLKNHILKRISYLKSQVAAEKFIDGWSLKGAKKELKQQNKKLKKYG